MDKLVNLPDYAAIFTTYYDSLYDASYPLTERSINLVGEDGSILFKYMAQMLAAWLVSKGALIKPAGASIPTHVPCTLLPSKIPRTEFEYAWSLQPAIQLMRDRMSRDRDFLNTALKAVIAHDEFTRNLINILNVVHDLGIRQPIYHSCQRSDYMIDGVRDKNDNISLNTEKTNLRQIEMNTISVGISSLQRKVSQCHRILCDRLGGDCNPVPISQCSSDIELAKFLIEGWRAYGKQNTALLMVVLEVENNIYDQIGLETLFYESFEPQYDGEKCPALIRMCLREIFERSTLGPDDELYIDETIEIALVYFRAGYSPNHYSTACEWNARLLMEKSKAIKSPTVGLQLAGLKKIQQLLCSDPSLLEKYLPEKEYCSMLRATFAKQYSLTSKDPETRHAIVSAIHHPERYVLKPQREGGSNNLYGNEMIGILKQTDIETIDQFVLMEYIRPEPQRSFFVRKGVITPEIIVSELGIYGTFMGDGTNPPSINKTTGYLLRSKSHTALDGGVSNGICVIDTISLV